jgi:hypothetical protein
MSELCHVLKSNTAVSATMKSTIFWDVTPSSQVEAHRRFGGTCCLHRQGQRVSQESNQEGAGNKQSFAGYFLGLLDPEGSSETSVIT